MLYELRDFFDIAVLRAAGAAPLRSGVMGARRENLFWGLRAVVPVAAPSQGATSCLSGVEPMAIPDFGLWTCPAASDPVAPGRTSLGGWTPLDSR